MSEQETYERSDLLALTPGRYLRKGFRGEEGKLRSELTGVYATAAATQLEAAGVSLDELSATLEALRLVLPLHQGRPRRRFSAAYAEALETVSVMYGQPNNRGMVRWLNQCKTAIQAEDDMTAFLEHFTAVVRQYAVITVLKEL